MPCLFYIFIFISYTRVYFRKMKSVGTGRFVKSTFFEKNIFLNINENYQN